MTRDDRPALAGAAACALAMAVGVFTALRGTPDFGAARWGSVATGIGGNVVLHSLEVFALLLLSFRYGRLARADARAAREAAVMAAGLAIFAAFGSSPMLFVAENASDIAAFVAAPIAAAAWLWHAARGSRPRAPRNMALFVLAVPVASRAIALWTPFEGAAGASARTLALAIFAYGVLKHQMLGLDVRVRWTISRTTLAAVFVAVFFIASETAQEFLGQSLGGAYVGILAAGLLVFAMAPLSRLADRLAERAVPVEAEPAVARQDRRELSYRRVLVRYLADGELSRDEERALAELAADLGIDAGRAFALREDVEREVERSSHPAEAA